MDMTTLTLFSIIPAVLVFLGGLVVQRAAPPEKAGGRLLLYLLVVDAALILIPWTIRLLPGDFQRLSAQIEFLVSPVLVGVLALVVLHLRRWKELRPPERAAALALGLAPLTLVALVRGESSALILFTFGAALLVLLVWSLRARFGFILILALLIFALLAFSFPFGGRFDVLPAPLQVMVGMLYALLPALGVALAAALISEGLYPPDWARLTLAALLLAALAYQVYWQSVWDQTSDGLGGLFYASIGGLVGVGAGLVLAASAGGRTRWAGALFALGLPLLMTAAFNLGWDASYHQITTRRAERIQTALERFHARQGRYPQNLKELTPFTLPVISGPIILRGEGWCYQGGAEYYRLGAFYREFFGSPLSLRVYASKGQPLEDWACTARLVEMQARFPSYMNTTEAIIPTPVPQPTSAVGMPREPVQPLAADPSAQPGSWSPDGRYYLFAAGGAPQFLETATGQVCPAEATIGSMDGLYGRSAWRADGSLLYMDPQENLLLLRPCRPGGDDLTARFPARFQSILAQDEAGGRLLLKSADAYWILDAAALRAWPVAGVSPNPYELHWDHAAWSPGGEQLAISRLNGQDARAGSTLYRIDGGSGAVLASIPLTDASDQSAPMVEWVSDTAVLLHGQGDLLRYDFSSDPPLVSSLMKDLFSLDLKYPDEISAMAALPDPGGLGYRLALRANHPRNQAVYLYDSQVNQVAVLHPQHNALIFFPGGQWVEMRGLEFNQPTQDRYDLYRYTGGTIEPAPLTVQGHLPREYPSLAVEYLPASNRLAFASQQGVSLVSAGSGALERFWALTGGSGVAPWVLAAPNESGLIVFVDRVGLYWIALR